MAINRILFSIIALLIMSSSASAVPFDHDYTVHGKVIGVVATQSGDTICYVAVKDPNNDYYSGRYHALTDINQCQTARMAYALGLEAKLWGKVAEGNHSNKAVAVELYSGDVKWWN